MSETQERDTELVAGVIGGITQKKADTWTIQVTPEGANFAKNLWTKDANLVESLSVKIGQQGAFVGSLGAPYTVQGKEVRSWWIDSLANGTENLPHATTPVSAPNAASAKPSSEGLTKEEWRRKDIAADKRAYTAIAASALQHTMPSTPTREDLNTFMENVSWLTINWMKVQNALRDGEDVPF